MSKLRLALALYRALPLQNSVNEFRVSLKARLLILIWVLLLSKGVLNFKKGSFWLNTRFLGVGSVLMDGWQDIWAFQVAQGLLAEPLPAILSPSSSPVIEPSGPTVSWADFGVGSK
jgi:hypothetical protein